MYTVPSKGHSNVLSLCPAVVDCVPCEPCKWPLPEDLVDQGRKDLRDIRERERERGGEREREREREGALGEEDDSVSTKVYLINFAKYRFRSCEILQFSQNDLCEVRKFFPFEFSLRGMYEH